MVGIHHRGGTFSPSPAQSLVTASSHSPHGTPSNNSLTAGANSLTKIVVAQVYLLLSTIKEDKDRTKWDLQAEQLRKLIDEHGMEVFQKAFCRLVVGNAPQIFPGIKGSVANSGNYPFLVAELRKVSHDVDQAGKIAESIETASEELFRDFDLSTFMEHFKMDALEKTILALAFKAGSRPDLKTKADAILSANYAPFTQILARPSPNNHDVLSPTFVATVVERFVQYPPPNFNENARNELAMAIRIRYSSADQEQTPPVEVLAALYLQYILVEKNALALYIQRAGSSFTIDEDICTKYLRNVGNIRLDEEQVGAALLYTAISRSPVLSTVTLASSLRKVVPKGFRWEQVVAEFDKAELRITASQFLALYNALIPLAEGNDDDSLDIQCLWGGQWVNPETQLSFVTAYASLSPEQLDASTIPNLQRSFELDIYEGAPKVVMDRASRALKHPLVSTAALAAVFYIALQSPGASDTPEAKRLFQEVVVPNLDIFLVSAFGVPKPWPELAKETINSLFDRFLFKINANYEFVLYSVWRLDKTWVVTRLIEAHGRSPPDLPIILDHAVQQEWLDELILLLSGFGLDLAALAHARGLLDLEKWQRMHSQHPHELAQVLLTFLSFKADHELRVRDQRSDQQQLLSVMLPVRTVSALLTILLEVLPPTHRDDSMAVQRQCITAYPRLINYGQGFDDIIDANGQERNSLPKEANDKMEEHYKQMYNEDVKVVAVLEALRKYKHSRDPTDQDVFACMIHGLFDEYSLYGTYPLEALKTTALLFGGIICYKLLPLLPLEIGLGMILDAVKDHSPDQPMYKFGAEALKQTLDLFSEWPGLCRQLTQIPHLKGTDAWAKAEEVICDLDAEAARNKTGNGAMSRGELLNGDSIANGTFEEVNNAEPSAVPFTSVNIDPPRYGHLYEDPSDETQEKVLFVLNNITERNLESKFQELEDVIEDRYQSWFAGHLVEDRAKMQPNYHQLYLDLVKLFDSKNLWDEILRETFVSVIRMLNSESTMQSSSERAHLKNLADWLGSLTLARDKPIKHRNIAFKQLLIEAFETQRLIVVLPFVCKVLLKGATSAIFKPPNPWLMDIIHLLIELYHHAELKLNLKFEIEVLCKELTLDHRSIEPSTDIQARLLQLEEPLDPLALDVVDRFDSISLNGMGGGVSNGRFSPQEITSSIPDLGPLLVYPPANDLVNQARLQDIVRNAITRAVHEIISPVVERSVTIAAISTAQMIHKDFSTEPDETRVRSAAVNMVKRTAGSLALVTCKEPLRASMSNYIRSLSGELPQGLPEGTIIMCVNSNLDMACSQVEKKAEEHAVPEIEEIIEPELEFRRRHRATRTTEPFVPSDLSRWSMTIPSPYKLMPGVPGGLNPEQMAIYDEFARQPRVAALSSTSHGPSSSDATRSMANDILQDQYVSMPSLLTPAETPGIQHMGSQPQSFTQPATPMTNGRVSAQPIDPIALVAKIDELLENLVRATSTSAENRYVDLPRPHPVLDVVDTILTVVLNASRRSGSDEASQYTAEKICHHLVTQVDDSLLLESMVSILEQLCKYSTQTARRVVMFIAHQPDERLLDVPMAMALMSTEIPLLEWQRLDLATSKGLLQRKEAALDFLSRLLHRVLLNDRPMALRADFARSLEALTLWLREEPELETGQQLVRDLAARGLPQSLDKDSGGASNDRKDQMEYTFEEWIHLCNNPNATDVSFMAFIDQLHNKQILNDVDSSCLFFRLCIDTSVDYFEHHIQRTGQIVDAYLSIDALAKLIVRLVKQQGERVGEVKNNKAAYLNSVLSLVVLVLNHHYVMRGEGFNQKAFFRLFSTMLCEFNSIAEQLNDSDRQEILLVYSETLVLLEPSRFPGFVFGWLALVSHRDFMPELLRLPSQRGWEPLVKILESLLYFLGELYKPLQPSPLSRDIYHGTMKLLTVLHHDYPEFLADNHTRLCAAVSTSCPQLNNMILTANPSTFSKMVDPLQSGLKVDRIEEIRESPAISADVEAPLRQAGLLDLIDQALQSGPSEDAVAHVAHAIHRRNGHNTITGFLPVNVDVKLIDSIVLYVGMHSVAKAAQKGGPTFVQASADAALLAMLVRELSPEARYYFLNSIVNQLRYPNAHTHYFSQALLELFGTDMNDPEESEIRQQITRIVLERAIGQWPQPWGLLLFIVEIVKNDKYMFFDLPFIKAAPEVAERFAAIAQRTL
ncbi:MAG: hypothetical protein M1818_005191 [Claussenomyces sp. TS43310]|nr:MAG: hypothetical protein M1818_005191 [Claussenomyces sp. TS43310]